MIAETDGCSARPENNEGHNIGERSGAENPAWKNSFLLFSS
jgi:hypothetical protein